MNHTNGQTAATAAAKAQNAVPSAYDMPPEAAGAFITAASEEAAENFSDPVQEAVQTIAALHARAERRVDTHQRRIERISSIIGRPAALYLVLTVVGLWISLNLGMGASGKTAWDAPPFYWMQGVIGLAALLTTLMVVITQHRQDIADERRAQLDLQISLVIEQKTTKLIALVEELRRDLPNVQNRTDPEAERMTESADPQVMLVALEHMLSDAVEEITELQDEEAAKASKQEETFVMPKPPV